MTTWYPDTCQCIVTISDSSATLGQTTGYVSACTYHTSYSHADVLLENQRKNLATNDVTMHSTGDYTWAFSLDTSRVLTITYTSSHPPAAARAVLQSSLNTAYGAGKVVLV